MREVFVKYNDSRSRRLNELYIHTKIHSYLLSSSSRPIRDLGELLCEVRLKVRLTDLQFFLIDWQISFHFSLFFFPLFSFCLWFTSTFLWLRFWFVFVFFSWCLITCFKMCCINGYDLISDITFRYGLGN